MLIAATERSNSDLVEEKLNLCSERVAKNGDGYI